MKENLLGWLHPHLINGTAIYPNAWVEILGGTLDSFFFFFLNNTLPFPSTQFNSKFFGLTPKYLLNLTSPTISNAIVLVVVTIISPLAL